MPFLRTLHAWVGFTLALILITVSLTGTFLVWKQEYVMMRLSPESRTFNPTPENLAGIGAAIEKQFDNTAVLQIQFATQKFPLTKIILADAHYAYVDRNGEVVDRWQKNERVEEWIYDLHHRLLLENVGLTVLGFSAIALIFVLFLGVVTFWPMRRALKRGIFPKGKSRPQLLAAHRNFGFVVSLPLLIVLLTGVLMVFPEPSEKWLLEPFRGEDYSLEFSENVDEISGGESGDWLPVLQRALAIFPDSQIRTATLPSDASPYRVIGLQQSSELNPTGKSKIYIEADGGWMDVRIDAQDQHISERIYNLSYPLHTGRIDNIPYKVFLTLLGFSIAVLSFLGLISFAKKFIG